MPISSQKAQKRQLTSKIYISLIFLCF